MACSELDFRDVFVRATSNEPYPYQVRLAVSKESPDLARIPTGLGKTAAITLSWLWRRRFSPQEIREATPRKLVFCLPMRTLVEQTRASMVEWLNNLGLLAGEIKQVKGKLTYVPDFSDGESNGSPGDVNSKGSSRIPIPIVVLMGGEERTDWDQFPELDMIILGTQDMLLSRALNRGYGMSIYRWPMHFGMLNNDCQWVFDEVQLMGAGVPTGAQLDAFRQKFGTLKPSRSFWMSATLDEEWLRTVDRVKSSADCPLELNEEDMADPRVRNRFDSPKTLLSMPERYDEPKALAARISHEHLPGTLTLVIVNTVRRARDLFMQVKKLPKDADVVLLHSHFRPPDRQRNLDRLLGQPNRAGTICISTQVIEAGVDVSARTLFTELAPWSSIVQRLGRCNRMGEFAEAKVFWWDIPDEERESIFLPYAKAELEKARNLLTSLEGKNVSSAHLPPTKMAIGDYSVIRSKDMIELFDTTTDLSGHITDVSRFIRVGVDTDVNVFWRELPKEGPTSAIAEKKEEICSAPISEVKVLIKNENAWIWDYLDSNWVKAVDANIRPGITILLDSRSGHYTPEGGWDPKEEGAVPTVTSDAERDREEEGYDDDLLAETGWETIATHSELVSGICNHLAQELGLDGALVSGLRMATHWHDCGKAHPAFQKRLKEDKLLRARDLFGFEALFAKAPKESWLSSRTENLPRKHFRHELVSAMMTLQNGQSDLVTYLVAAHHGKVRMSVRSMPDEDVPPDPNLRYARGVWEGDAIPAVDLGDGLIARPTIIDLSCMDLGLTDGRPSWRARMEELRDDPRFGPFRLAFLEALIKASDERASRSVK